MNKNVISVLKFQEKKFPLFIIPFTQADSFQELRKWKLKSNYIFVSSPFLRSLDFSLSVFDGYKEQIYDAFKYNNNNVVL